MRKGGMRGWRWQLLIQHGGKDTEQRENNPKHRPCFVSHYCSNSRLIGNGLDVFRNTRNIWISLEELRFSEWRLPSSSQAKDSHITTCPLSFSPFSFFKFILFLFFPLPFQQMGGWTFDSVENSWRETLRNPGRATEPFFPLSRLIPCCFSALWIQPRAVLCW